MNLILDAIIDYSQTEETDYAILLTGKWGAGKTHYWKNIVYPELSKTEIPNSNEYFKPLYVSLYSLSELREIELRILFELIPFLRPKNKEKLGTITTLSRNILGAASGIFLNLDADKLLKGVKLSSFYTLDNMKYFLCFDDFERVDPNLGVTKVLGFINNYIEHDKIKTLIITNEEHILDKDDEYKRLKEKVVGRTLTFQRDDASTLQNILSSYDQIEKIKTKTVAIDELIQKVFNIGGEDNLRSLKFALTILNRISRSSGAIISKKDVDSSLLQNIIILVFAISFEFKKGNIVDSKDLKKLFLTEIDKFGANFYAKKKEDSEDSYFHLFNKLTKEYFEPFDSEFIYVDSICRYIVSGCLDEQKLVQELNDIIYGNVEPHQTALKQIRTFRTLNQSEFDKIVTDLKNYVTLNKFTLGELLVLASFFLFFLDRKLIVDDKSTLIRMFKEAIQAKSNHSDYQHRLEEYLSVLDDQPYKDDMIKLIKTAKEANKRLQLEHESKIVEDLLSLMKRDIDGLYEVLVLLEDKYNSTPILKNFPLQDFFEVVIDSDNEGLKYFNVFFENRYKHFGAHLSDERIFLEKLSDKIAHYEKQHDNYKIGLTLFNILELNRKLKDIATNLQTTTSKKGSAVLT